MDSIYRYGEEYHKLEARIKKSTVYRDCFNRFEDTINDRFQEIYGINELNTYIYNCIKTCIGDMAIDMRGIAECFNVYYLTTTLLRRQQVRREEILPTIEILLDDNNESICQERREYFMDLIFSAVVFFIRTYRLYECYSFLNAYDNRYARYFGEGKNYYVGENRLLNLNQTNFNQIDEIDDDVARKHEIAELYMSYSCILRDIISRPHSLNWNPDVRDGKYIDSNQKYVEDDSRYYRESGAEMDASQLTERIYDRLYDLERRYRALESENNDNRKMIIKGFGNPLALISNELKDIKGFVGAISQAILSGYVELNGRMLRPLVGSGANCFPTKSSFGFYLGVILGMKKSIYGREKQYPRQKVKEVFGEKENWGQHWANTKNRLWDSFSDAERNVLIDLLDRETLKSLFPEAKLKIDDIFAAKKAKK